MRERSTRRSRQRSGGRRSVARLVPLVPSACSGNRRGTGPAGASRAPLSTTTRRSRAAQPPPFSAFARYAGLRKAEIRFDNGRLRFCFRVSAIDAALLKSGCDACIVSTHQLLKLLTRYAAQNARPIVLLVFHGSSLALERLSCLRMWGQIAEIATISQALYSNWSQNPNGFEY